MDNNNEIALGFLKWMITAILLVLLISLLVLNFNKFIGTKTQSELCQKFYGQDWNSTQYSNNPTILFKCVNKDGDLRPQIYD